MKISEHILSVAMAQAAGLKVKDVRIGLGYTAVLLENDNAGLAYTFRCDVPEGCSVFHGNRPLAGKNAWALLPFLGSDLPIESALGLATANALLNHVKHGIQKGDVLQNVDIQPEDHVGMVGLFAPLVKPIKDKAASLKIFEKDPKRGHEGILPMHRMNEVLPGCQVVFITSTAILNGTIDDLLALAAGCREVVMLGASTPLAPEVFKDTPVSCLSGVIVLRPKEIMRMVSEGCGMRHFGDAIEKLNIRV
jgi:uncharacterized protein (DUF4213/DUF364 family)